MKIIIEYKGFTVRLTRGEVRGKWRYSWANKTTACQCYTSYDTESEAKAAAFENVEEHIELIALKGRDT